MYARGGLVARVLPTAVMRRAAAARAGLRPIPRRSRAVTSGNLASHMEPMVYSFSAELQHFAFQAGRSPEILVPFGVAFPGTGGVNSALASGVVSPRNASRSGHAIT